MAEQAIPQAQVGVEEEEISVASQWRLMWWRFKKHKPAMVSGVILGLFYLLFPLAEFMGPGDPAEISAPYHLLRPQALRLFDGGFNPHVNGLKGFRDLETFKRDYEVLPDEKIPLGFFVHGFKYKFLGFMKTDRHLFGFTDAETYEERPSPFLLGSDTVGRDQMSRILLSIRISLSIGLVGVVISTVMSILLGGISGYYGGAADTLIQRMIEIIHSIPTLPLWMALSSAVPRDWSILQVYFALTVILAVVGGLGGGRTLRGLFLAIREEDFVMAARLAGASDVRIMFRHILPSVYSLLIAGLSLAVPGMIIGETALSFLGLGLRAPAVSFGVMLQQAQNPAVVALYPWLMFVAIPVIIIVLCFNFFGDGLRDAADPYGNK